MEPGLVTGGRTSGAAAAQHAGGMFFQIGFQRCGTTAIALFFNRSGIPAVHFDRGRLAQRMRANLAAGERPLAGYDERYRAFTNMNWNSADDFFDAFKHYGELRAAYGGRFILNTRPPEHWVRSVMAHKARRGRREMTAQYELRFGTADPARVRQCLLRDWEEHHRRVVAEIPADELLVFDIEADPPERLSDFVGVPRACARYYTRQNATMSVFGNLLAKAMPVAVKERVPQRFKRPVKNLLSKPAR